MVTDEQQAASLPRTEVERDHSQQRTLGQVKAGLGFARRPLDGLALGGRGQGGQVAVTAGAGGIGVGTDHLPTLWLAQEAQVQGIVVRQQVGDYLLQERRGKGRVRFKEDSLIVVLRVR